MRVIIQIEGREAIPVRALPWATDWWFGADDVSDALGQEESFACFAQVRAWRVENSTPVPLLPRIWQRVSIAIEEVRAANLDRCSWEEQATYALPADTFVWLDEWLDAYNQHPDGSGPKEAMAALLDADGDHDGAEALRRDAEEARFCREPSAAEHLRGTILAGFEAPVDKPAADQGDRLPVAKGSQEATREAMLMAISRLGLNPLALEPPKRNGLESPSKQLVFEALLEDPRMTKDKVEHAWKQLKADKKIGYRHR